MEFRVKGSEVSGLRVWGFGFRGVGFRVGGADRIAERLLRRVGREGAAARIGKQGQLLELRGDRPNQKRVRLLPVCRILFIYFIHSLILFKFSTALGIS